MKREKEDCAGAVRSCNTREKEIERRASKHEGNREKMTTYKKSKCKEK